MSSDSGTLGRIEQLEGARDQFLSFVRGKVADPETAEEILQEAMLRALQGVGELRDEEKRVSWFYAILRNAIVDHYRRRSRDARFLASPLRDEVAAEGEGDYRVLCLCFRPLIETLKPEYAELIQALDLDGESPEAAARRLGLTPTNLKVRRHRARRALRRRLEETCRVCAAHHCLDCTCRQDTSPG